MQFWLFLHQKTKWKAQKGKKHSFSLIQALIGGFVIVGFLIPQERNPTDSKVNLYNLAIKIAQKGENEYGL